MLIIALAAPVLFGAAALAVDVTMWARQRGHIQGAADAAALAAAKELSLASGNNDRVVAVAKTVVAANLRNSEAGTVTVTATLVNNNTAVRVVVAQPSILVLGRSIRTDPPIIQASATARSAGKRLCVIGLDPNADDTILGKDSSTLTANGCAIQSMSRNSEGLSAEGSAKMAATSICTAGGSTGGSRFQPQPSPCSPLVDPLATSARPSAGPVRSDKKLDVKTNTTLLPGTYVGGIDIGNTVRVTLAPGEYTIKSGELKVHGDAIMEGEGVGFHFTGTQPTFKFHGKATVNLSAPKTGVMAGFLVYEDPNVATSSRYEITSPNVSKLLGTIYLPKGELFIDTPTGKAIAEQSAFTVIVARRVQTAGFSNVVINSKYEMTDVPVPANTGVIGGTSRITQ